MKDERREILYLDMWVGERIQEMKLAGIRRYAAARGWSVMAFSESESRPENMRKILAKRKPVGCIVECSAAHEDLLPRLFGKTPVVYLDGRRNLYGGGVPKVVHDGEATTRAAFRELSENRPKSYAVVDYREYRPWARIRVREFTRLAADAGKPLYKFLWRDENESFRSKRLEEWVLKLPWKCAVFAVNDDTAAEVVGACRRIGRKIPTEMTLLGVDNLERVCEALDPTVSSIQVDFERAGYHAAKMLDGLISPRNEVCRDDRFGPLMTVRRESTRGFGRKEPRILDAVGLIRREACNGLTAADVVKCFTGSRRLVELRFRETLGHSILDEIQNVRMEKVQFLLAKTDTPISAIAARCGYRSDVALRKAFRLFTGKSLADWRKANG